MTEPIKSTNSATVSAPTTNAIKDSLKRQLSTRVVFPETAVVGICYSKLFGPRNAVTPEGHPITISSGMFNTTTTAPALAMALAAKKRFGIEVYLPHWELEFEEDVIHHHHQSGPLKIPYDKLYHFKYLAETQKWADRGLTDENVHNHFKNSHYITKNWQRSVVTPKEVPALSASVLPISTSKETK